MRTAAVASVAMVVALSLLGCQPAAAKIDGSSAEAFQATHAKLMQSLTPPEQVQLVLAEQVILAAATPRAAQDTSNRSTEFVPLLSVRSELNGLDFNGILALSRAKHVKVNVGFVSEPSNNALDQARGQ